MLVVVIDNIFFLITFNRLLQVDNKALVLEDLNSFDFKLANRKCRLDLNQSKIVLENLAKFHALTAGKNYFSFY